MADCCNCGAPLPLHSTVCRYCHTRNDIDLKEIHYYTEHKPERPRICPRCRLTLKSIDLSTKKSFLIERCERCYGLFFDPNELEALLEKETAHVYGIDFQRLGRLMQEKHTGSFPVAYLKCPVCLTPMHRVNFGSRSGVIVDRCKDHGVWLDNGELHQLLEWVKSGGALLHRQREEEKKEEEEKKRREKAKELARFAARYDPQPASDSWASRQEDQDLLDLLVRWIGKTF